MKYLIACAALLGILFAAAVGARGTVPVIDYENIAIATGSNATLSADQVRQGIVAGVNALSGAGWTVSGAAGNNLLGNLTVRGKHSIAVQIGFDQGQFSVRYANSTNMKFSEEAGVRYIHPSYNKWVGTLVQSIRSEFARR